MKKNSVEEREITPEELADRAARKKNVIAFALCTLIAFMLWIAIMNSDGANSETSSPDTPFELSETQIEMIV